MGGLLGGPGCREAPGKAGMRVEEQGGRRPLKPKTSAEGPRVSASGCSRGPLGAGRGRGCGTARHRAPRPRGGLGDGGKVL